MSCEEETCPEVEVIHQRQEYNEMNIFNSVHFENKTRQSLRASRDTGRRHLHTEFGTANVTKEMRRRERDGGIFKEPCVPSQLEKSTKKCEKTREKKKTPQLGQMIPEESAIRADSSNSKTPEDEPNEPHSSRSKGQRHSNSPMITMNAKKTAISFRFLVWEWMD